MTALMIVGTEVRVFVSDPWEFGTECGVGPFAATIVDVDKDTLLLNLREPIEYRGSHLRTLVARARYAPGTIEQSTSEERLAANLVFFRFLFKALSQVTCDAKEGMVPAIGSVESTAG